MKMTALADKELEISGNIIHICQNIYNLFKVKINKKEEWKEKKQRIGNMRRMRRIRERAYE